MKIIYLFLVAFMVYACNSANDSNQTSISSNISDSSNGYQVKTFELPDTLSFAGESVPLNRFDIQESLDREIMVNTYWHSHTLLLIKRANKWLPLIEKILKEQGIHNDFKYLAVIESELTNAVSPAGATGFWQFMKRTAADYNLEVSKTVDERYNVEKSTIAACKYLKHAHKLFDNWTLAAASYNMGMGGLRKRLKQQDVDSYYDLYLNPETARYVYRMLAMKLILSKPEKYGFTINESHLYTEPSYKTLEVDSSITNLVSFAKKQGTNYKLLKALNPWMRNTSLENKSSKTYKIKIHEINK